LWQEYQKHKAWDTAAESALGKYSIPIMTIHKSKGLEYDTVVFVGLEDAAFWDFGNQQEAESCAFFVALSRAKKRVIFTFSQVRNTGWGGAIKPQARVQIGSLYDILESSGIAETIDFRDRGDE
jgi:DNA helicase-2/ATP-dependent DNA helicase PcrA